MSDVSVFACPDYSDASVAAALKKTLVDSGFLDFVKPGMKILIKANLVSMIKPDGAATTHPSLLCELTRILLERSAEVVIGDSPGGLFNSVWVGRVYAAAGMKAVEKAGAKLNDNFEQKLAKSGSDAKILKEFQYTAYLDDCDAIINFCKLKSHAMMSMSCAVKNMFGAIPGMLKPEYHFKCPEYSDFADMLIDLNEYFKPRLSVVDAVWGMEGNGPTMGDPRHIGAVIASPSPYAADLVSAAIIGLDIASVPTIERAHARGLCSKEVGELDIDGEYTPFIADNFKVVCDKSSLFFENQFGGILGKAFGGIVKAAMKSKPDVKCNECVGCGKCAEMCPAHAIEIKDKIPKIDRKKCICCFCCQEFCPVGAMKARRPIIARILNK